MHRRLILFAAVLTALVALAPSTASAHRSHDSHGWSPYGATTLDVDPGTLAALGSLGVAPGAVRPGTLSGAQYSFPITTSLQKAFRKGVISHRGGISLTAGETTVKLTDFDIDLGKRQLFGEVNGAGPVALLDLDFAGAGVRFKYGRLAIGPVTATLTDGAAAALNEAFGTDALSSAVVLGKATVSYRLFGGRW